MPGVHWLPSSGANFGTDDRAPDYRTVDLAVQAPSDWHVAGPGRSGGNGTWHFAPEVPVAKFALIAGAFERRALPFQGSEYELLIHPMHMDNLRRFDELHGTFAAWVRTDYLEPVVARGLDYPYGTFSLVEVPARLRRYGGGWRMDTLQALPGVQLLSEQGFPTRRFSPVGEDGLRRQMTDLDRMGPSTVHATAGTLRNLLSFSTAPTGDGAAALDVLVEMLMARWAGQPRWMRYHTVVPPAHWISLPEQTVPVLPVERLGGFAGLQPLDVRGVPEADWRRLEQTPLVEVDPSEGRESFEFLAHRGDQVARAMHGLLGQQRTRDLLALLCRGHAGSTNTAADFVAAVRATDPSVGDLVDRWLREASAPGFVTSPSEVSRIADGPDGEPRYQIRVHVHNAEAVPGVVALAWRDEASAGFFDTRSPPYYRGAPTKVDAGAAVEGCRRRYTAHRCVARSLRVVEPVRNAACPDFAVTARCCPRRTAGRLPAEYLAAARHRGRRPRSWLLRGFRNANLGWGDTGGTGHHAATVRLEPARLAATSRRGLVREGRRVGSLPAHDRPHTRR